MNLFHYLKEEVIQSITKLQDRGLISCKEDLVAKKLIVDTPSSDKYGDLYTNAAMVIGKLEKRNPMEVAGILSQGFCLIDGVDSVEVAAPGFINFRIAPRFWCSIVKSINELGDRYGRVDLGVGEVVNVEFVSANPTGPLHIGHARGAVFGDVLSNLLEWVGYSVTREYYINDAGAQINKLVASVFFRYREILCGEVGTAIESGLYPGEYLKPVANALVEIHGDSLLRMDEEARVGIIRDFAVDRMLELIKSDLELLGVRHDVFVSEADLHRRKVIEGCVACLEKKGIVYNGILEKPKGRDADTAWLPRTQLLFRSKEFGDDLDRALQKEDGAWTYFAGDIAYHFDKISRGFHHMVVGLGSDHKGYVARLQAAVRAMSDGKAVLDVKLHNIVNFLESGVPVKMSKRKGDFLTVRDVVEEVGRDVTRFIMLTRKNDVVLDFDFVRVKEQSKNNPIFYIQYAHARVCSLVHNFPAILHVDKVDFSLISSDAELALIMVLARWPCVVESAARNSEPHRIAFYLIEVAEAFHVLWGYGNRDANMKFIVEGNLALTSARLYLAKAVAIVIALGLSVFSILPVEEMR